MSPSDFKIIFYDELGRVVGLEFGRHDEDHECWEYAREKMPQLRGATAFAVWRGEEFVCAEGDGAIDAVALMERQRNQNR